MCSIHVAEESTHTGTAEFIERMDQLFNAFNSQTLTSPALLQHALTVTSGHKVFLLIILNWLSKIKSKSKGNDGSILMLLDVVSFVIYILDYYMYQIDLNLKNGIFWLFKSNQGKLFQTSCVCYDLHLPFINELWVSY